MSIPKLFLGCSALAALLEVEAGYLDNGTLYNLLATTDRAALAGIGGEVAFYYLYLAVMHEKAVVIKTTPIIDGVEMTASSYTLLHPTTRTLRLVKVPISVKLPATVSGFATLSSFSARGCWIRAKVETVHIAEVLAALTTALAGANNDLLFTAVAGQGEDANSITIRYVNPGTPSAALSISVVGRAITVNLATSGASAITTTAADIIAAIAADASASALVTAANAPANTGVGVVTALAATALTGGVDGPGYLDVEGVEVEHKVVRQGMTVGSNK